MWFSAGSNTSRFSNQMSEDVLVRKAYLHFTFSVPTILNWVESSRFEMKEHYYSNFKGCLAPSSVVGEPRVEESPSILLNGLNSEYVVIQLFIEPRTLGPRWLLISFDVCSFWDVMESFTMPCSMARSQSFAFHLRLSTASASRPPPPFDAFCILGTNRVWICIDYYTCNPLYLNHKYIRTDSISRIEHL